MVAIFLSVGAITAFADAYIRRKFGAVKGKAAGHAVTGVFIAALGAAFLDIECGLLFSCASRRETSRGG